MTTTELDRLCDQAWRLYILIGSRAQVDHSPRTTRVYRKAGARYDRRANRLDDWQRNP